MKTGFGVLLLAFSSLVYSGRMIDASDFPSGGSGSTALVLGMIHALPMLGAAAWTRSKLLTVLTGIGMVGVAIGVGGARYAVLDLFFVALGTWGALRLCVPKGLPVTLHVENQAASIFTGHTTKHGESELTEYEQGLLRKIFEMKEFAEALESLSDEQQGAFWENLTEEELEELKDLMEASEQVVALAPNSDFARDYKRAVDKERQRQAEKRDRKLQMAAERAAARINAYNAQHREDFGDNAPPKATVTDILAVLEKSASK